MHVLFARVQLSLLTGVALETNSPTHGQKHTIRESIWKSQVQSVPGEQLQDLHTFEEPHAPSEESQVSRRRLADGLGLRHVASSLGCRID